jgi:hypothetical protein
MSSSPVAWGMVEGQKEPACPACTAVQAGQLFASFPLWGQMLDRDQALAHPWVNAFWTVIDYILPSEKTVRRHVSHQASGQSDA